MADEGILPGPQYELINENSQQNHAGQDDKLLHDTLLPGTRHGIRQDRQGLDTGVPNRLCLVGKSHDHGPQTNSQDHHRDHYDYLFHCSSFSACSYRLMVLKKYRKHFLLL